MLDIVTKKKKNQHFLALYLFLFFFFSSSLDDFLLLLFLYFGHLDDLTQLSFKWKAISTLQAKIKKKTKISIFYFLFLTRFIIIKFKPTFYLLQFPQF